MSREGGESGTTAFLRSFWPDATDVDLQLVQQGSVLWARDAESLREWLITQVPVKEVFQKLRGNDRLGAQERKEMISGFQDMFIFWPSSALTRATASWGAGQLPSFHSSGVTGGRTSPTFRRRLESYMHGSVRQHKKCEPIGVAINGLLDWDDWKHTFRTLELRTKQGLLGPVSSRN